MTGATLGLVPSINKVKPGFSEPFGGSQVVEVDKLQARCTRLRKNLGVGAKLLSLAGTRQAWMLTLTYADTCGTLCAITGLGATVAASSAATSGSWKPRPARVAIRSGKAPRITTSLCGCLTVWNALCGIPWAGGLTA